MKHRKLFVLMILLTVPCFLWAEVPKETFIAESKLPLLLDLFNGFSVRLFLLLGGIIPGLFLTIKFSAEMIKTYYSREQNPEAFKSAIIKFAMAVFVIFNIVLITIFVFGNNGGPATKNLSDAVNEISRVRKTI